MSNKNFKKQKEQLRKNVIRKERNGRIMVITIILSAILIASILIYEMPEQSVNTPNGLSSTGNFPKSIGGFSKIAPHPSTVDGKIQVQFIGSLACPHCAEISWSLYTALKTVGTWHGLEEIYSNPTDQFPNTPGLSFANATFSSSSIAFFENEISNRNWEPYQSLNTTDQKLFSSDDPSGGIPFILIGGMYLRIGDYFSPEILSNTSGSTIMKWLSTNVDNSMTDNIHNVTVDIESVLNELEKKSNTSIISNFGVISASNVVVSDERAFSDMTIGQKVTVIGSLLNSFGVNDNSQFIYIL